AHETREKGRRLRERMHARLRVRPVHDPDRNAIRRLRAERETERQRQQEREPEDPEDRLRLAEELFGAHTGELDERVPYAAVTHRAAPFRSARRRDPRASRHASTA